MIVLDTHVWLWWAAAPERLSTAVRAALDAADALGVPTISCWEVAMLVLRGRVALDRDVGAWVRAGLAAERVEALPLSPEIAVSAALLEREGFPGDAADRIVYATARNLGARLATRDEALHRFDSARAVVNGKRTRVPVRTRG